MAIIFPLPTIFLLNIMVKSQLEHQVKPLKLSMILDLPIYGFQITLAGLLLVLYIQHSIHPNLLLMSPMVLNLILHMVQEVLMDLLAKIRLL